jgi:hypothetical protein
VCVAGCVRHSRVSRAWTPRATVHVCLAADTWNCDRALHAPRHTSSHLVTPRHTATTRMPHTHDHNTHHVTRRHTHTHTYTHVTHTRHTRSLVHIELAAVDLSWDIIARFGADVAYRHALPRAFFDDFVQVGAAACARWNVRAWMRACVLRCTRDACGCAWPHNIAPPARLPETKHVTPVP